MNAYLSSVIEQVKARHADEPEFVQTVEEVFSSLEPVIEKHPEYEQVDLLNRMVASIVNYRMAGSRAPRDAGLDAVRETNYAKALIRSLSYWRKNWRTQTKDYFFG